MILHEIAFLLYEIVLLRVFEEITGSNFVYISVDETTDARGSFVANLVTGVLRPVKERRSFFISCKSLEKTNHGTIVQFVNNS